MLSKEQTLKVAAELLKHRPLRLSSLAQRAGWSRFYLRRRFREVVGESPAGFQQRLNLEQAALRLQQTDESVLSIALACGYESHEVFTRAFRRQFSCTPRAYRKRVRRTTWHDARRHARVVHQVGPCIGLYHTTMDSKRKTAVPTSEIKQIDLQTRPVLLIQRRVPHAQLQPLFAECFPKLYGYCMQHGCEMAGNPIARYVEYTPGMTTVDCIIPLQSAAEGDGEIEAGTLQAGPAAFATHSGPYDTLNETYSAVEAWLTEHNLETSGPNWEWYVTDPSEEPDPAQWKTEVYFPVKAK